MPHRARQAPRRAVTLWLRTLGDLLGELDSAGATQVDTTMLTGNFTPREVSSNADDRLFILAAFAGAEFNATYQGRPPALAHLFNLVMGEYRAWDPAGVGALTPEGMGRAMEHLESLARD